MASEYKIKIEVSPGPGWDKLTSGSATSIASELGKVLSTKESIGKSISMGDDVKTMADQITVMTEAFKGFANAEGQSKDKLYSQFKQAQASYEMRSPDYTFEGRGQKEAKSLYENLTKNMKTFDDFSKAGDEATYQVRQFIEAQKLANKELSGSAKGGSQLLSKLNAFNVAELLVAAAARSATGYATAGAAYQQGFIGTSGSALSQLRVSTDIAQRNAISNAVQAALPALGMAIGGAIGGVPGYIGGAALGYAASLPVAMWQASRNVAQSQQLTVQSQSALMTLFGGGGAAQQVNIPGMAGFGTLTSYNVNSRLADLINKQEGNLTSFSAAFSLPMTRYRQNQSGISDSFLQTFGSYIASTGEDPSAIASSIAFLSAKTGMSPQDIFMAATNIGSRTGQLTGDVLSQVVPLVAQTTLGNFGSASAFLRNTAPYGQAYQQTAIGYQGAGFQQKIAMNVIGNAFGVNMSGVMSGHASDIKKFNSVVNEMNKEGNIGGVGVGDIMGQIMMQGPANYYSVHNAPNVPSASGATTNITPQTIQQAAPSAYQQAVQSAQVTAGSATIIIKNLSNVGKREANLLGGFY